MSKFAHYQSGHPPRDDQVAKESLVQDKRHNSTTCSLAAPPLISGATPPALPALFSPSMPGSDPSSPFPSHSECVDDLRELPPWHRFSLLAGPTIKVLDDDVFAMGLPRVLFLAASIESRLINEFNHVRLPPSTGLESIMAVCSSPLLIYVTPHAFQLRSKKNLKADLIICRAARLLRMERYILHIHSHYWWKLCNKPFTAADVQDIIGIAMGPEDCYLRLVSQLVAARKREGSVINPDAMQT